MIWAGLVTLVSALAGPLLAFLPLVPGGTTEAASALRAGISTGNAVVDMKTVIMLCLPLYSAFVVGMPMIFSVYMYNKVRGR